MDENSKVVELNMQTILENTRREVMDNKERLDGRLSMIDDFKKFFSDPSIHVIKSVPAEEANEDKEVESSEDKE